MMWRVLVASVLVVVSAGCTGGDEIVTQTAVDVQFLPAEVDLGRVVYGQTKTTELRVDNAGFAPGRIEAAVIEGPSGPAMAALDVPAADLPAGGGGRVRIRLSAAQTPGLFSADVVLTIEGQPHRVPLTAQVVPPPACDDGNPCTLDILDGETCVHEVLPDGAVCDDDNLCTENEVCTLGQCMGTARACDDGVDCTVDACDPAVGCVAPPDHGRCADGDDCTEDVCSATAGCQNPVMDEGAVCAQDGCNLIGFCTAGACVQVATPDGFPCDDSDPCTAGDVCSAGACVGAEAEGVANPAPQVVAQGMYGTDLCHRDFSAANLEPCFDPGVSLMPDRVLAVRRWGNGHQAIWRTTFATEYGAECTPDSMFQYVPPVDQGAPDDEDADVAPYPPYCAAGVFLSTISADGLTTSQQLTAVRGEPAAAFTSMHTLTGALGPDIIVAAPTEEPDVVLVDVMLEGGADRQSSALYLPMAFEENRPNDIAVALHQHQAVVATIGSNIMNYDVDCDDDFCTGPGPCCAPTGGHVWVFNAFINFAIPPVLHRFDRATLETGCIGPSLDAPGDDIHLGIDQGVLTVVHRDLTTCSTSGEMAAYAASIDLSAEPLYFTTSFLPVPAEHPYALAVATGHSPFAPLIASTGLSCALGQDDGPCDFTLSRAVGGFLGTETIGQLSIWPQQILAAGSDTHPITVVRNNVHTRILSPGEDQLLVWPDGQFDFRHSGAMATDGQVLAASVYPAFGPPLITTAVAVMPLHCGLEEVPIAPGPPLDCQNDDDCGQGEWCEFPLCLDVDCEGLECGNCLPTCNNTAQHCNAWAGDAICDPELPPPIPDEACPGHTAWADSTGCGDWVCVEPHSCEAVDP